MINNNPTVFATPAILLLLLSLLSFSSPSLTMAQQTGATTTTTTPSPPTTGQTTASPPSPPLTPQEQEQQTRLQNVIAATNQNLDETEKQIGGVVYTPRWSEPVWVEPDSLAVLIAYCLPGEFAESGQEILGGFELEVLESYEVALPQDFMAWMMVIGNEDRQDRLPAAVGVVCASDLNDAQTRVVSPEEQQQINNIVQQFTTIQNRQITNIDQVINIINNATTTPQNGNTTTTTPTTPGGGTPTTPGGGTPTTPGGGTPTTPGGGTPTITATANPAIHNVPCPLTPIQFSGTITDNVGNRDVTYRFIFSTGATTPEQIIRFNEPGSQSVSYTSPGIAPPSLQGWVAIEILQPVQLQSNQAEMQITCTARAGSADTTPPTLGTFATSGITENPQGDQIQYKIVAEDNVDGTATLGENNILIQDNVGGAITIFCNPPSGSVFPIGLTRGECYATDAAGNPGRVAFSVNLELIAPRTLVDDTAAPDEGEPAAPDEGEPAAPDEGEEAATTPPVDNTG
jgi:hypothetical protein